MRMLLANLFFRRTLIILIGRLQATQRGSRFRVFRLSRIRTRSAANNSVQETAENIKPGVVFFLKQFARAKHQIHTRDEYKRRRRRLFRSDRSGGKLPDD